MMIRVPVIEVKTAERTGQIPAAGGSSVIYADNAATTLMRHSVISKYATMCSEAYGNPSSLHALGRKARDVLEDARVVHAKYMGGVPADTVYFTSCGTESNNIIIRGVMAGARAKGRDLAVISSVEHSSVRKTAEQVCGADRCILVPVDDVGRVDEWAFEDILQRNADRIALVSVILAQNEVGVFQQIPKLVTTVRRIGGHEIMFHTDATQAFGKYVISPEDLGVDLMTASAHKYHGPRGVGVLYAKKGALDPVHLPMSGGGQERGCRSGTENVPAIAAAAEALECMLGDDRESMRRKTEVRRMRDFVIRGVVSSVPGCKVLGDPAVGLYNLVSISLPGGVAGSDVAAALDSKGIYIGSGSACNKGKPSAGLLAMHKTEQEVRGVIRISLCEFNTQGQCEVLVREIVGAWKALASRK